MEKIPAQQVLTIDGRGEHLLLPIEEVKQYYNDQVRHILQGQEIKLVTCDSEGFQRVFWINRSDIHTLWEN